MREYAPRTENGLQWHTITAGHMPPIGETFLLWRGVNESDGGFVTIARRWESEGKNAHIVFVRATAEHFHALLDDDEYKHCRWAAITPPRCVMKKRIKERERMEALRREG